MCGEADSYDGDECMVCGFVAPPDKFQDPDVDMARQVDLRARNDGTLDGQDAAGLSADINDKNRDGFDDATGEPIDPDAQAAEQGAMDAQPMLQCPVCGFETEAAEPTSTSTTDPQVGDDGADPGDAAEGDLCPNCGRGVMETPEQVDEEADAAQGGPAQDDDPSADARANPDGAQPGDIDDPDADPNDPGADQDPGNGGFPDQDPKGSPAKADDSDDDSDEDSDSDPADGPPVKKKKSPFK